MKKSKSNNNYRFYNFITCIVRFAGNIWFGGKVIGKENIPQKGKCILAGNHVSDFDAYLLFSSTKRPIHILGKIELFQGPFAWLFKKMHLIPVDRSTKNPEAIEKGISILLEDKILGIFPEGTYHKNDLLLPFKPGVINFAEKTNSPIIPFAIIGEFKFRSKPIIKIGKPLYLEKIKTKDKLKYFESVIEKMLTNKKGLE